MYIHVRIPWGTYDFINEESLRLLIYADRFSTCKKGKVVCINARIRRNIMHAVDRIVTKIVIRSIVANIDNFAKDSQSSERSGYSSCLACCLPDNFFDSFAALRACSDFSPIFLTLCNVGQSLKR